MTSRQPDGRRLAHDGQEVGIIRLDNIGDHVLGSGFVRGLRTQLPQARITLFTRPETASLYQHCPCIDRCVALQGLAPPGMPASARDRNRLGAPAPCTDRYDLVVNPRFARDYYGAGAIAQRLAATRAVAFRQQEAADNACYSELVDAPGGVHVAEYSNILLGHLFGQPLRHAPEVWTHPLHRQRVVRLLRQRGWNGQDDILLIAPGASEPLRAWPEHRLLALIREIIHAARGLVVLIGSVQERSRYPGLRHCRHPLLVDAMGLFSLSELAACCGLASLFIGTDSGPKHIAAAAGLRVIEINHLPRDIDAEIEARWPTGRCWSAYGVESVQIRPQGAYTEADILAGKTIAAVTSAQVMEEIDHFLACRRQG